jgi:hypothetical protein
MLSVPYSFLEEDTVNSNDKFPWFVCTSKQFAEILYLPGARDSKGKVMEPFLLEFKAGTKSWDKGKIRVSLTVK